MDDINAVVRSKEYYDDLLRELDDRQQPPVVPPLDLRSSFKSPRGIYSRSSTARPGTSRPMTGMSARPNTARTFVAESFERETRRIEYLCEREAKYMLTSKAPRDNSEMILNLYQVHLKGRELDIERALLDPYRNHEEKFKLLLERVQDRENAEKEQRRRNFKPPVLKKQDEDEDENKATIDEKITNVISRRAALIHAENVILQRKTDLWREKVKAYSESQENVDTIYKRKQRWITLVTAVNRMIVIGKIVQMNRDMKTKNLKKWRAVVTMQRYWRKFCPSAKRALRRGKKRESMIISLRRSLGAQAGEKLLQYQARVSACTVITAFLRNKGFKVAVLQFIWKVKQLQRKIRSHLLTNQSRIEFITRCTELMSPSLLLHIHIVFAGRGYDLSNITSYESGQLQRHLTAANNHRLVRQMNTPSFHAFLRQYINRFSTLLKESTVVNMTNNKTLIETAAKYPVTLDFVFSKRRQFSLVFNSQLRLEVKIPKVNVEDARSFVQGGTDPISTFLEEIEAKEHEMISNYAARRRRAMKNSTAPPDAKLMNNTMLFIAKLTAQELAMLTLQITERANQVVLQAAQAAAQAKHLANLLLLAAAEDSQFSEVAAANLLRRQSTLSGTSGGGPSNSRPGTATGAGGAGGNSNEPTAATDTYIQLDHVGVGPDALNNAASSNALNSRGYNNSSSSGGGGDGSRHQPTRPPGARRTSTSRVASRDSSHPGSPTDSRRNSFRGGQSHGRSGGPKLLNLAQAHAQAPVAMALSSSRPSTGSSASAAAAAGTGRRGVSSSSSSSRPSPVKKKKK